MRLPESFSGASWANAATADAVRPAGTGGGYSRLWNEVNTEVRHFIEHGGGQDAAEVSAEGAWRRWQVERSAALSTSSVGTDAPAVSAAERERFLAQVGPAATTAARELGVSPELVVAHAALESGWGRRPLRNADGSSSHNLFGIKADGAWRGDALQALTTEHEDGRDQLRTERFRSYADLDSAMNDYARLLRSNPRYRSALGAGSDAVAFAQGLARGGYATDPDYARKLAQVARQLQSGD